MTTRTIALYARKGGVGRTLLTQNLAGAYAEQGHRVLLIDTDPQGSLSKNFFGAKAVQRLRSYQTVAALFDSRREPDPADMVHATEVPGIAIVPASDHLEPYDLPQPLKHGSLRFALRDFLRDVRRSFDVILIDTPPNVSNLPGWNALMVADYVLTPVNPKKNSAESILDVKARLMTAIEHGNPDLIDLGYLVNNLDIRSAKQRAIELKMRQLYGPQVFDSVVYSRVRFEEAAYEYQPITHWRPTSAEADMIRRVQTEVTRRAAGAAQMRNDRIAAVG